MSEVNSTPAAPASTPSAPAASAASTATPAAASAPAAATTVAAPASTEGAASAAAATTPAAETTAAVPSDAGKSTLQVMQEAQAAKDAEAAAAVAAAEATPAKTPEEIAAEAAAAGTKSPEETAAETAAAEEAAAAAKAEEDAAGNDDDLPGFELDPIALAPKELAAKLDADPALKAALEGNADLKSELFANARLAAETAAFKAVVASPEDAARAVAAHATFTDITSAMQSITDGDMTTLQPVMGAMLEASAIRDADGNLQYFDNGVLKTNGMVGKFLRNSFEQKLTLLAADFTKAGDEEGQAAIDILMERAGLRTPSSANEETMSAEVKAQLDEVKAERAKLATEKQAGAAEAAKTYNTTVNTRIDAMMETGIETVLSSADGLTPFARKTLKNNIHDALVKQVKGNKFFRQEMAALEALPYDANRQKQHMTVASKYFNQGMNSQAVKACFEEAGVTITAKQKAQADKSAARTEAARSEVRGAQTPTKAAPALTGPEQVSSVIADLTKNLGRSPTNLEVMAENFKRNSAAAA